MIKIEVLWARLELLMGLAWHVSKDFQLWFFRPLANASGSAATKIQQWNNLQRGCYSSSNDTDVFFCFEVVLTTRSLIVAPYSDYQSEQYDIIQNLYNECMGYWRVSQWLNENEYLTPGGMRLFNIHVHSIPKRNDWGRTAKPRGRI